MDNFDHCICKAGFSLNDSGRCTCIPPILVAGECLTLNVNCSTNQVQTSNGINQKCVCKNGFTKVLDRCVQCEQNESFDNDTLTCVCSNNTVKLRDKCVPCGKNQRYDSVEKKCLCVGNTFETENALECVSCPPKMTLENGKCECIFNFYFSSA